MLTRKFEENIHGKTINGREIKSPHPQLIKKLNVNHLSGRASHRRSSSEEDTVSEKFDQDAAITIMRSKHT